MRDSSTGRRQRKLSADEARLFRDVLGDIKPYDHAAAPPPVEQAPEPKPAPAQPLITIRRPETVIASTAARDLDAATAHRLRRGQLPIDARLDLHGFTQDQARAALIKLVEDGFRRGLRCLLVITGKGRPGRRSNDESYEGFAGILKQAVPRWLNGPPLAHLVLATATAKPDHGGDGALYVLVRRNRGLG